MVKKTNGGNNMAYENVDGWKLYVRDVKLKEERTCTIYFFSKRIPKSGTACDLPEGHAMGMNKRTGIPYLKKK